MRTLIFTLAVAVCSANIALAQSIPDVYINSSWQTKYSNIGNVAGSKVALEHTVIKSMLQENTQKSNGAIILDYHFKADGAVAMVAFFDELFLGSGTQIRAYSPINGFSTKYFTKNENRYTTSFALPYVIGNELIVEVKCEDQEAYDSFRLTMSQVGLLKSLADFGEAPACFANVNCPEGTPWEDQKRSVVKYMTVIGTDIGYCTGVLINNTNEDNKNYFLSAQHCGIGASTAELGQFIFYFNYESPNCTSPANDNGLDQQTVVGCIKIAESGGSTSLPPDRSDFLLLELNNIPATYNVFYAGWNREPAAQLQGNGSIIQHPQGDLKKITFWDNVDISFTSQDHLEVHCIASANGDGIVEPMSSGSPVFDVNKTIIGNITAGASGCISGIGSSNAFAVAGKFEVHWDQCGTENNRQLKPWLDPLNTGVVSLAGKNQSGVVGIDHLPDANSVIQIYPNPAKDQIYINSSIPVQSVEVYSIRGELLYTSTKTGKIDISKLPKGIVIISVRTINGVVTRKITLYN